MLPTLILFCIVLLTACEKRYPATLQATKDSTILVVKNTDEQDYLMSSNLDYVPAKRTPNDTVWYYCIDCLPSTLTSIDTVVTDHGIEYHTWIKVLVE